MSKVEFWHGWGHYKGFWFFLAVGLHSFFLVQFLFIFFQCVVVTSQSVVHFQGVLIKTKSVLCEDCVVKNVEPHHCLSPVCLMHLRRRRLNFSFLIMSQQIEASVGWLARCWWWILGMGTLGAWTCSAKDRCTRQTPSSLSTTSRILRSSYVLRKMVTYTAHSDRTISDFWTNGSCWRQRVFYSFRHCQRYHCPSDHKCGHRHLLLM